MVKYEDFSFVVEIQLLKKENEILKVVMEKLVELVVKVEEEKKCLVVVVKLENLILVEKFFVLVRIG